MTEQVTRAVARFVVASRREDVPRDVSHEAKRAVLNWLGCAVGASQHETVTRALDALAPFFGPPQATVIGRGHGADIMHAALLNGIASHTFDFDDTHLRTVIHPAGPVASAILALGEYAGVTGSDFLHAFVLGVEVECRIGNAVYPSHYDLGWHITGTAGVFGAAAAAGKILGLTEQRLIWALGIAATQSSGLREMFGSMCKPFHVGAAARNGLAAALLAAKDFTSADDAIEGRRDFANVLSAERDYGAITERLGDTWELLHNTYKPFACGIVIHPAIDGCIQLRNDHRLALEGIEKIELRVHPLVLELTGKTNPRVGLEGKFSVFHCAAVAIIDGAAGEAQFSDARVKDPAVIALRERVRATVDASIDEDAAVVSITLRDGRIVKKHIEHAIGSLAHPMSDADLEAKFRGLCEPILATEAIEALIEACWQLDRAERLDAIASQTDPRRHGRSRQAGATPLVSDEHLDTRGYA
ncbi:MAG TPA: MmgE/PrpD family protein [Casimicrobiaceae bacterium]|nr:MmgE/PrpD family protein [Casimicrobiaceae bacterium]